MAVRQVCPLLNYKIWWHCKQKFNVKDWTGLDWTELSEHNSQNLASVHMLMTIQVLSRDFLDQHSHYQLVKKDIAQWLYLEKIYHPKTSAV